MSNLHIAALRDLSPLQVHGIYRLRVDVFVHEQRTPFAEIDDLDAAADTLHCVAAGGRGVTGTARIHPALIDGREVVQFGRFAVAPQARGSGLGPMIMDSMLTRAAELYPDRPVYLTAQEPLTGYYTRYGFTPAGEVFLDTGIPHQPMLRPASGPERGL